MTVQGLPVACGTRDGGILAVGPPNPDCFTSLPRYGLFFKAFITAETKSGQGAIRK
jgi:hypothetical protein